ncbi:MAG: hypothetical protein V1914_01070 [archaeon]
MTLLDLYFITQADKKAELQETEELVKDTITNLDESISKIAANYILEVVADPNNQKRAGIPVVQYPEIKKRVLKEEPRFTEAHLKEGLEKLLHTGKIESERVELTLERYMKTSFTIYYTKEDKK